VKQRSGSEVLALGLDDVMAAVREFAAVLTGTPEYRAFDLARTALLDDKAAQRAIRAYQEKQNALSWRWQAGLLDDAERQEINRLYDAMMAEPAVKAYLEAQSRLGTLCREVSDLISRETGLNLSAGCGPGCACGK